MKGSVVIDPARGEMSIGDVVLPVGFSDSTGDVHVLPPTGPVLRPLLFGERYRVVDHAVFAPDAAGSLSRAILERATAVASERELGDGERRACEALALHLAGAEIDAPCYADTMLLLAGNCGWSYDEIEHAEAARADRLARRLQPPASEADDGWNRVVFAAPEAVDPETVARGLAMRLLERFDDAPFAFAAGQPGRGGVFSPPPQTADASGFSIGSMTAPESPARVRGGMNDVRDAGATASAKKGSEAPLDAAGTTGAAKVLGFQTRWQPSGQRNTASPASSTSREQLQDSETAHPGVRLLRGSMATASSQASALRRNRERAAEAEQISAASLPEDSASAAQIASPSRRNSGSESAAGKTPDLSSPPMHRASAEAPFRSRLGTDAGVTVVRPEDNSAAQAGFADPASRSIPERGRLRETRDVPSPVRRPADDAWSASALSSQRTESVAWSSIPDGGTRPHEDDVPLATHALAAVFAAAEGGLATTAGQGLEGAVLDIADALAELLSDEADLRGLDR